MSIRTREAKEADIEAITAVYNAGVADRVVFQPVPRESAHFARMLEAGTLVLVAEDDGGGVTGAAWVSDYDPVNAYYAGVGEATVYIDPGARRGGAGRALLAALAEEAARRGRHKLVAKIFADNAASRGLFAACGYREVGTHRRHGTLDGEWHDVTVVERSLDGNT